MEKAFTDHFGRVAADYAHSRPGYPPALFAWLAEQCAGHGLAWDCGTGSGQAATALARHFRQVLATDASAAQIARAVPSPGVEYRLAAAESSGLPAGSVDIVVVAQALHWFDLNRFYAEVRRVLRPGGVVAAWSYGVLRLEGEAADAAVQRFYREVVGPYWPPERHHVETGYRELAFPFAVIPAPAFALQADWRLEQLLGYFRSWSATARFIADRGFDPVAELAPGLQAVWGGADRRRQVAWPLAILAGRTP